MADVVVDLGHWRRAQRLLPILVDRHGLAFFLDDNTPFPKAPRLAQERLDRCVFVAATWIERRSGRPIDSVGRASLRRLLIRHLEERLLSVSAQRR
jgi:hypothetical protein